MFAEIVFPLPLRGALTYRVPPQLLQDAVPGKRAVAPLGRRMLTGFITAVKEQPGITNTAAIKPIAELLDAEPVVLPTEMAFYQWLAEYYLSSVGEALRFAVPQGTEVQTKKHVTADKTFCLELLAKEKSADTPRARVLTALAQSGGGAVKQLQKAAGKKNIQQLLASLEQAGAVTIHTELEGSKVKEKTVTCVKQAAPADEIYDLLPALEKRSPKQVAFLLRLLQLHGAGISAAAIARETGVSAAAIKALAAKGVVTLYPERINRGYTETYTVPASQWELTAAQHSAVTAVAEKMQAGGFAPFLLHGVTGSGKTLVYMELIERALAAGKSALLMVPEISLTPQVTAVLLHRFRDDVALLHSRLSLGQRFDAWQALLQGRKRVAVGPRSALFAPFANPGIIIVDEEHDHSYKQQDMAPRYHARDAAVVKAKLYGCPVVLGSATPSIESMHNALAGKYALLELPERVDGARLPDIQLVSMAEEKKQRRVDGTLSHTLLQKIDSRLKKKEGIIILQNRRGFATQLYCFDCGEIALCEHCSVSLVLHLNNNILQCHYCGFTKPVPDCCAHCGSDAIRYFGTGTERVEDELAQHFPEAVIERLDSDSLSGKGVLAGILNRFRTGEADILVGTQIVAKGLDFPRVTLVGVVSAETTLWLPDFRADERTFQLLTQVAGRAGRNQTGGEVLIQTQNASAFVLKKVVLNDYHGFYTYEIKERERRGYPPFTRLCLIEVKDKEEQKARQAIGELHTLLQPYRQVLTITPPATAIVAKLKGEFRYQLVIKSRRGTDPSGARLRAAASAAYAAFSRSSAVKDTRVYIDIDPQSIL